MKQVLKNWHWPYHRINNNGDIEWACPHNVGHGGIHGCDGCCAHESFSNRVRYKKVHKEDVLLDVLIDGKIVKLDGKGKIRKK